MHKPEPMIIYNLFPTLAGTFAQWEPHLIRAAEMAFNWIFVNPIQKPGQSGSLYSIADYYDFNPLLVDTKSKKKPEAQLRDCLKKAEKLGLKVMVDLVINHCAADSPLLKQHPAWFEWEPHGEVRHPFADENGEKVVWYDLAKFNFEGTSDREGLYRYIFEMVDWLIGLGFHGFRCDAAYQLPKTIWERLISETRKKHPHIRFLAETLGCTADETTNTARAGFDYIFNSSKWWDFNGAWLMEQYNLTRHIAPSISFPESHDTERLMEESNGNLAALKQRYLFAALYSAGVMMPMGYEFGFRKRLLVTKTRPEDWEQNATDLRPFIRHVNGLKARYTLLQEERPMQILHHANDNVLVLWNASAHTREEALLILNKDVYNRQTFREEDLYRLVQAGGVPLEDVSPEYPINFVPTPFVYELNPGQGLVFITARKPLGVL